MITGLSTARKARPQHVASLLMRCASALTIFAVLNVGYLAANPEAHEHLHADADHADHVCAITLAGVGYCDTAAALPVVSRIDAWEPDFVHAKSDHAWPTPHYWLRPAQAPPVAAL